MNKLTIVGLGPGSKSYLTLDALEVLLSDHVYVRTIKHPIMSYLIEKGGRFTAFDDHYETCEKFEDVYQSIADEVKSLLEEKDVIYAVPGNPFVAESTVERLLDMIPQEQIKIVHGASFIDAIVTTLRLDPVYGLKVIDGLTIQDMVADVTSDALIIQVYDQRVASNVKLKLMEYYEDDQEVIVVRGAGIEGEEVIEYVPLYQLDRVECLDHLTSVYIPMVDPEDRRKFFMSDLEKVMTILRGEDGCPWDREQTHASLRRYLIEEAYEVIDAIEQDDLWNLEEELGDLLLQVVFHAVIAAENGYFNMTDVITGIHDKMVRRHPHVFSTVEVDNSDQVLVNWEAIKKDEKSEETVSEGIVNIPKSFPPILRAEKIQKKLAKVGFDWPDVDGALSKVHEELEELLEAIETGEHIEKELGDILFALVNVARILKIDPSESLHLTNEKVTERFSFVEKAVLEEYESFENVSLEVMDRFWDLAKKHEI